MRSGTSRGVSECSGGKELYIGSAVSAIGKVSGSLVSYRDHRIGPGGPQGGATHLGGPHGLKWGGEPAHSGLVRPLLGPPAPRDGNPRVGGASTCLGGHSTPPVRRPLGRFPSPGPAPPQGAYIKERGGRAAAPQALAPPSPLLHLSLSPCWIKAWETSPGCTCVERGGAVRSTLGHR